MLIGPKLGKVEKDKEGTWSSRCGKPFMFMKDSAAGIVEAGPQPGSFGLGAPGLENVAVVKERETVRFMEE